MSQSRIGATRPDLGDVPRRAPRRRDLRTEASLQDNPVPAEQGTLPGRQRRAPGSQPIVWQTWLVGADIVDKDPDQRHPARNPATRSEPPRSGDTASRIRKANVRAALFKKPEPVRIGRFILLDRLGAGAMGEVYAAYDEQLDRKVALKLVRSSARDENRGDERLLREAQTLAQISHPNVVQVYEAGSHDGGVFIAMEFIRGKTLAAWLEGIQELPRPERQREILRQFIAAGRGLEAAHRAGLAHRDFKPDNVLVGDDGRVRVVDFGLARAVADTTTASGERPSAAAAPAPAPDTAEESALHDVLVVTGEPTWDMGPLAAPSSDHPAVPDRELLSMESTEAVTPAPELVTPPGAQAEPGEQRKAALRLTATGMVMGTPRYMAPEQMRGQTPDHRSDQFSFCVALFHALYGEWPFKGANALELMRAAARGQLEQPKSQAEVPAAIRKAILRGLSAVPGERFADIGELLRVLEARLQRRRRSVWVVAAAALVTGSAVAFAAVGRAPEPCAEITSGIDALWSDARKQALGSAFRASGQVYAGIAWRSTATAIDEYVATWRSGARDACEATHVHQRQSAELLDRRMLCLDRGRQRLDALLASMDGGTAPLDAKLVERAFDAASALPDLAVCSNAEALLLSVEPPAEPALARSVAEVRRHLAEARTQVLLGRYREGLRIAQEQLPIAETLQYEPLRAEALFHVASALAKTRGTRPDSERSGVILLDAVDIAEGVRHDQLAVEIWHELVLLADQFHSSMEHGHAWSRREQAAVRRIGDPDQARAQALHALGHLYQRDGKYAMAITQYNLAVTLVKKTQPRSARLAAYYHDLANSEQSRGDYQSARTLFEGALGMALEQHGDMHPKVAWLQLDFAMLLLALDEGDQARTMLESALATSKQLHGSEHYLIGKILTELSNVETWAGNFTPARAYALEAQRIFDDGGFPPDHRLRAYLDWSLGTMALHQHDFTAAHAAFESALAIYHHHHGDRHLQVAWAHTLLAESLLGLGRYEDTIEQCDAAQASTAEGAGGTTELRARLLSIRGRARPGRDDVEPAISVLEQAVSQYRQLDGYRWERAAALWALARALRAGDNGAGTRARALAEEARAIYELRGNADARVRQDITDWLEEHDKP